jgi:flagellar protein FliO/FliZ
MTLLRLPSLFLISWFTTAVNASETTPKNLSAIPSTGAGLQQSLIGLLIVLAVIVGLAWLTRQVRGRAPGSSQQIKVIAQLAVGAKERISLVELADTWILVGITQTQLNALHVMPKAALAPDTNTTPNQPFAALFDTIRSRSPHA